MPTTRRDFLNGTALAIAAGLTPAAQLAAQPSRYPPALTGLRGQHAGSFEVAHALARDHRRYAFEGAPAEEHYDLIVVGGGISGLAAAYFYRRAAGLNARILVLDNHDDFGGHAKRNEFMLDGRLVIGYGGSQSMQSPRTLWPAAAKRLLRELHVEVSRFETAFDRNLYSSLGLSRGVFFAREAFGRDALVAGDPMWMGTSEIRRSDMISAFPLSPAGKAQLLALYTSMRDPLAGKSVKEKQQILKTTSYRDYLIKICGCGEEVADCFQGRTHAYFALGCDAVPAADVLDSGYPGFQGLRLPEPSDPRENEPYIYHFPDGNASLARLLVRALIPGVAHGHTMDDIVLAPFDSSRLDAPGQNVRIRLDSTCVDVRNTRDRVLLGYVREGALRRVAGKHVVLACFHDMIPYLMPELKAAQREALAQCVRAPLVYIKVLVRNLAPVGEPQGAFDFGADVVPQHGDAGFPREPRRLPQSARSGRADVPAARACAGCAEAGADGAPAISHRAGQAPGDDVCGFRGPDPRRARPDAGRRRVFQRARHRGDHRQSLAARLFLHRQFAVRQRWLRRGGGARPAEVRPRRHRQFRFRRGCLCAYRDRSG